MPDVVVYTAPHCLYCFRAKQLLAKRGIAFRDIDVRALDGGRRFLREQTGRSSVPQIFVGGTFVGGYYELAQMDRDGTLQELVKARADESGPGDSSGGPDAERLGESPTPTGPQPPEPRTRGDA